jgi:acetylornithine deacetylase
VQWHGFLADGYVLEPGTEAEAVLAEAHRAAFNEEMPARITTAVNDTRFYGLYFDMPALCYGPKGEGAHAFDERTNLEHLKTTTLAMAAFIADWCGLKTLE